MMATQGKVNKYVKEALKMPLDSGQLVAMVILHFDIFEEDAKEMVIEALQKELKAQLSYLRKVTK